jgi:ankyrin repeat protein
MANNLFNLNSINAFLSKAFDLIDRVVNKYEDLEYFWGMKRLRVENFGRLYCGKGIQNKFILMLAAEQGRLDVLEYAVNSGTKVKLDDIAYYACFCGNVDSLSYLHENGFLSSIHFGAAFIGAFYGNHSNILDYLLGEMQAPITKCVIKESIKSGNINLMLKIVANVKIKIKPLESYLSYAIFSGNLEMVKTVLELGLTKEKSIKHWVLRSCAIHGSIDIARYFIEDCNIDPKKSAERIILIAVRNKRLEFVRFLAGLNIDVALTKNNKPLEIAAAETDIEMCKYLISKGASAKNAAKSILREAAFFEKIDLVKYLLEIDMSFQQILDAFASVDSQNLSYPELKAKLMDLTADSKKQRQVCELLLKASSKGDMDIVRHVLPLCKDKDFLNNSIERAVHNLKNEVADFIIQEKGPDCLNPGSNIILAAIYTGQINQVRYVIETLGCNVEGSLNDFQKSATVALCYGAASPHIADYIKKYLDSIKK